MLFPSVMQRSCSTTRAHVVIVEMDPLLHRLLHGVPVSLFKALLRAGSDFKKTPILRVKSLQYRLGNQ